MSEHRGGVRRSVWQHDDEVLPSFEPLTGQHTCDVCVIGGGLTGVTAAYLLAERGKSVILIERHRLGQGVTGSTTAHITSLVDFDYAEMADQLGLDAVREVHDSARGAIDHIAATVERTGASCAFRRVEGFLYAEPGQDEDPVRKGVEALREAGVSGVRLEEHSTTGRWALPFETGPTLVIEGQAAFHPLRYLAALIEAARGAGAQLHEHTRAARVDDGGGEVHLASGGVIRAGHIVQATHSPVGVNLVQTEMRCQRSYVLAAKLGAPLPEGLYFDTAEPYHYLRMAHADDDALAIIGGADHETGKGEPERAMEDLERYARERLDVREVVARWSAQVYEPGDGLPLIGWSPGSERTFIATGFAGDGMVFGTLSALMARDMIVDGESRWAERYRPSRLSARAMKTVSKKGLETTKDAVFRRLKRDAKALADVGRDEGRLVRVDGAQLAVYRDRDGSVHACSATCPHMKCVVHWNAFERTWDCACHGSRFSPGGAVLEGPSIGDLERVTVDD